MMSTEEDQRPFIVVCVTKLEAQYGVLSIKEQARILIAVSCRHHQYIPDGSPEPVGEGDDRYYFRQYIKK